jgi:hypothetical protein
MTTLPRYIPHLPRSQLRRAIVDELAAIHPSNTPSGDTQNFFSEVRNVQDTWSADDEIPDLPAIEFRFSDDVNEAQQSRRLRILQNFELKLVVGGPKSETAALLDALRDDVIAALYGSDLDGFGYGVEYLSGVEVPVTSLTRRVMVMRWQVRYDRRMILENNRTGATP